jgi:5-formyltetrahydrofolate cyclo-ligase
MTKKELRKIYLNKRMELPEPEYLLMNKKICDNLFGSVDFSAVTVLHTFLPIKANREVDTWQIIERINKSYPQIRICIPKMNNQTSELEHYYFEGPQQLQNNMWGIPEPVKGVPAPTEKIDAVLVPLLAFDRRGHRIGYGRGFYDRFLVSCRPDCRKIGLSFFQGEDRIDEIDDKDVALDLIVTPDSAVLI